MIAIKKIPHLSAIECAEGGVVRNMANFDGALVFAVLIHGGRGKCQGLLSAAHLLQRVLPQRSIRRAL